MSGEIKVGDLVRVVDACCLKAKAMYLPYFSVVTLEMGDGPECRCMHCKSPMPRRILAGNGDESCICPIPWLRRIDPLSEPETTQEEATA